MNISEIIISPYVIPLRQPWQTSKGMWLERRGWLVHIVTSDGLEGIGEAAPFEEAGTESTTACLEALFQLQCLFDKQDVASSLERLSSLFLECPAARCAYETAFVSLLAQADTLPVAQWLNARAASSVRVNASAGALIKADAEQIIHQMDKGFDIIKLKVGVSSVEDEISKLEQLSTQLLSHVLFRLDANAAWTMDEAEKFLSASSGMRIESLEEPLKAPDLQRLDNLQHLVPYPIALDENLKVVQKREDLLQTSLKRIVLKPMAIGGPLSTYRLGCWAKTHNITPIVTTTIDALPGTMAAVHCAAALDRGQNHAHGLATLGMLETSQSVELNLKDGKIIL